MVADTDKFIIATFALWAGDFLFFEKLLSTFSPPHRTVASERDMEEPEDFIRTTGALRLRQLWQKRSEFRKLAAEYSSERVQVTDTPMILETEHLRATLWRTGEREFIMQGYLKDLGWQDHLFTCAREQAAKSIEPIPETPQEELKLPRRKPKSSAQQTTSDIDPDDMSDEDYKELFHSIERPPILPLGASWTQIGNPFIQVELTDLGLLEATGLWTEGRLPKKADSIVEPFMKVLRNLDEPSRMVSRTKT